jgi:hypothetical protein
MKPRFPLFQKVTDTPTGGSGPAAAQTPVEAGKDADVDEEEESDEEEEEEDLGKDKKAGKGAAAAAAAGQAASIFDHGRAVLLSKGALVAENRNLHGQLSAANARIKTLEAETQANGSQTARIAELETELAAAKANAKTVEKGVQSELSKVGIDASQAPEQINADKAESGLTGYARVSNAFKTAARK